MKKMLCIFLMLSLVLSIVFAQDLPSDVVIEEPQSEPEPQPIITTSEPQKCECTGINEIKQTVKSLDAKVTPLHSLTIEILNQVRIDDKKIDRIEETVTSNNNNTVQIAEFLKQIPARVFYLIAPYINVLIGILLVVLIYIRAKPFVTNIYQKAKINNLTRKVQRLELIIKEKDEMVREIVEAQKIEQQNQRGGD